MRNLLICFVVFFYIFSLSVAGEEYISTEEAEIATSSAETAIPTATPSATISIQDPLVSPEASPSATVSNPTNTPIPPEEPEKESLLTRIIAFFFGKDEEEPGILSPITSLFTKEVPVDSDVRLDKRPEGVELPFEEATVIKERTNKQIVAGMYSAGKLVQLWTKDLEAGTEWVFVAEGDIVGTKTGFDLDGKTIFWLSEDGKTIQTYNSGTAGYTSVSYDPSQALDFIEYTDGVGTKKKATFTNGVFSFYELVVEQR